jgi:hypothetical protein
LTPGSFLSLDQARLNHQGGVQVALKDVKTGDSLDVLKGNGPTEINGESETLKSFQPASRRLIVTESFLGLSLAATADNLNL